MVDGKFFSFLIELEPHKAFGLQQQQEQNQKSQLFRIGYIDLLLSLSYFKSNMLS